MPKKRGLNTDIFILLLSSLQGNGFGFLDYISVDRIKSAISAGEM